IAEERVAAHGLRARYGEHRRRQRIGDLVLDDLRRLPGIGRADDHLHIGKIRNRVERHAVERPNAPCRHHQRGEQHEETVGDRPADETGDHRCPPSVLPAGGAFASPMRAAVPLRLASESTRNWPETTTLCPATRPLRTSVWPLLSMPTSTSTGANL